VLQRVVTVEGRVVGERVEQCSGTKVDDNDHERSDEQ
jgi:hypothetical protein